MKKLLPLVFAAALASCAHQEVEQVRYGVALPLDQTLANFSHSFNAGQFDAVRPLFAKGALIQSPVTPNSAPLDTFLARAAQRRFQWNFTDTEILLSMRESARTRGLARMLSPGKFSILEAVTVNWQLEDGAWKISRIEFANWPPLLGEWKRSGLRGEPTILLTIQPGGTFSVSAEEDRTSPSLRGRYQLLANKIIFMDDLSSDPKRFKTGLGSYLFSSSGRTLTLSKVEDENSWRSDRFDGIWAVAQ